MSMENPLKWAKKLPQTLITQLYKSHSLGLIDDDLADEVGYALYARCMSILAVTELHERSVLHCPSCEQVMQVLENEFLCTCGFRVSRQTAHDSYKKKQLYGANATHIFRDFVTQYPRCKEYNEKVICIDRLIHSFHSKTEKAIFEGTLNEGMDEDIVPSEFGRPVSANLIEGNLRDVIQFLRELSSAPSHTEWVENLDSISWVKENGM